MSASLRKIWRQAHQGGVLHPVPGLRLRANKACRLHATLRQTLISANKNVSLPPSKEGVKDLSVQILTNNLKENQARNNAASLSEACQQPKSFDFGKYRWRRRDPASSALRRGARPPPCR